MGEVGSTRGSTTDGARSPEEARDKAQVYVMDGDFTSNEMVSMVPTGDLIAEPIAGDA
jgi:hypothetical protein